MAFLSLLLSRPKSDTSRSVDATSRDFEPTDANNMTFGRFVLTACSSDDTPEPAGDALPPRHEAHAIVQHYMSNVYALYPCFSQTKLFTILDDLYQQDNRVIQDPDYWLAYMVLAVGYASQSRGRGDESYRKAVDFAGRALPYADGALAPGYVTQIQSLILLTQYSMVDPAHFDSWYLIGFASRAVVDLGFHQDPPQSQVGDMSALDMRRSIFYCVYSLDRSISMAHARAFSFGDDSINVSYPTSTPGRRNSRRESTIPSSTGAPGGILPSPITGPQDADPALSLFELRRKQSNWYQTLFQSEPTPLQDAAGFVWRMCLDMRDWNETLPSSLPAPIREHLDLELRYSYVYCLAPSSRAPQLTDYARALIFEHALAYSAAVHAVAHRDHAGALALYTYHDVLKVYFVATQFVTVLNDGAASAGAAGASAGVGIDGSAADALLAGVVPPVPFTRPGTAQPPPLPRQRQQENNVTRSLRCLHHVVETLQKLGERWDNALTLKESFEAMSGDLWSWLKVRKQMMESASPPNSQQHSTPTPPPAHQPQGQHPQQYQQQYQPQQQQYQMGPPQPPQQQQYRWV